MGPALNRISSGLIGNQAAEPIGAIRSEIVSAPALSCGLRSSCTEAGPGPEQEEDVQGEVGPLGLAGSAGRWRRVTERRTWKLTPSASWAPGLRRLYAQSLLVLPTRGSEVAGVCPPPPHTAVTRPGSACPPGNLGPGMCGQMWPVAEALGRLKGDLEAPGAAPPAPAPGGCRAGGASTLWAALHHLLPRAGLGTWPPLSPQA